MGKWQVYVVVTGDEIERKDDGNSDDGEEQMWKE